MTGSAILLGLAAVLAAPPDDPPAPRRAEVVAEAVPVFDRPSTAAFVTQTLHRGDRVTLRDAGDRPPGDGWQAIEPPPGSISWIDADALAIAGRGTARVAVAWTTLRAGSRKALLPGPAQGILERGAVVRLRDLPPLRLRQGGSLRTWRAIATPTDQLRFVRFRGIRPLKTIPSGEPANDPDAGERPARPRLRRTNGEPTARPAESLPTVELAPADPPEPWPATLPPGLSATIAGIETAHRAILRRSIEEWRLGEIVRDYDRLATTAPDPAVARVAALRRERARRQQEAADAAREFEAVLTRSRERDRALDTLRKRIAADESSQNAPFDATGLLQVSARMVEGHKVFALVGSAGTTAAYLIVPPGIDTLPLVARRVGVRGAVHYDETLRNRLIEVQELEPLEDPL